MKILRNKTYSDSDNETPKKVGEAIGTALVGTAGTVGATDLIKRGAKKYITSQESTKEKSRKQIKYIKQLPLKIMKPINQVLKLLRKL